MSKEKRKLNRFGGLSESEVSERTLADHLAPNLEILIIGINPGLTAAYKGHHYAGPGNHFWKCLYMSGLVDQPFTAMDDYKLIEYGIGFTNIVQRTTRSSNELTKDEMRRGATLLMEKLRTYAPKIAVFNGKGIYEMFSGTSRFNLGLQPKPLDGTQTQLFVMPSSSARCSHLPTANHKLTYYLALKKLRDHMREENEIKTLNLEDYTFGRLESPTKRKRNQLNGLPRDGDCESIARRSIYFEK